MIQSPSARIRETKEVLQRLEKRLERYYQPSSEGQAILKHSDLVKDFQSRLHERRLQQLGRSTQQPTSSVELKFSRASQSKLKHMPLDKTQSLGQIRSQPRLNKEPEQDIRTSNHQEISRQLRQLKKRLEKVQKSHIKKEVRLQRQVDKLKHKLSKSNKLNRLLVKQLSPSKTLMGASTTVHRKGASGNPHQPTGEAVKRRLHPLPKPGAVKRI